MNQKNQLFDLLDRYFKNKELGISHDSYLQIVEHLGEEYDESKAPPTEDMFPLEATLALYIFAQLPNRYAGMGGYCGKDLSPLKLLLDIHRIDEDSHSLVLEVVCWLDNRAITKSIKDAKRAAKSSK